jgi:hypothetical protein
MRGAAAMGIGGGRGARGGRVQGGAAQAPDPLLPPAAHAQMHSRPCRGTPPAAGWRQRPSAGSRSHSWRPSPSRASAALPPARRARGRGCRSASGAGGGGGPAPACGQAQAWRPAEHHTRPVARLPSPRRRRGARPPRPPGTPRSPSPCGSGSPAAPPGGRCSRRRCRGRQSQSRSPSSRPGCSWGADGAREGARRSRGAGQLLGGGARGTRRPRVCACLPRALSQAQGARRQGARGSPSPPLPTHHVVRNVTAPARILGRGRGRGRGSRVDARPGAAQRGASRPQPRRAAPAHPPPARPAAPRAPRSPAWSSARSSGSSDRPGAPQWERRGEGPRARRAQLISRGAGGRSGGGGRGDPGLGAPASRQSARSGRGRGSRRAGRPPSGPRQRAPRRPRGLGCGCCAARPGPPPPSPPPPPRRALLPPLPEKVGPNPTRPCFGSGADGSGLRGVPERGLRHRAGPGSAGDTGVRTMRSICREWLAARRSV